MRLVLWSTGHRCRLRERNGSVWIGPGKMRCLRVGARRFSRRHQRQARHIGGRIVDRRAFFLRSHQGFCRQNCCGHISRRCKERAKRRSTRSVSLEPVATRARPNPVRFRQLSRTDGKGGVTRPGKPHACCILRQVLRRLAQCLAVTWPWCDSQNIRNPGAFLDCMALRPRDSPSREPLAPP